MQRVHAVLTISRGPWLGVPRRGRSRAGTHHTVRGAWRGPWAGTQHSSRGGTGTRGRTRTRGASHWGVWCWHCPGSPAPRWAAGTWQKGDKRVAEEEMIFTKVVGCIHFNSFNLEKTFTNIWTAKLHMRLHSTVLFFLAADEQPSQKCGWILSNASEMKTYFSCCAAPNHPLRADALPAAGSTTALTLNMWKCCKGCTGAHTTGTVFTQTVKGCIVKYIKKMEWRTVRLTYSHRQDRRSGLNFCASEFRFVGGKSKLSSRRN